MKHQTRPPLLASDTPNESGSICPVCSREVVRGEAAGNVGGKAAHFECYIAWKRTHDATRDNGPTRRSS